MNNKNKKPTNKSFREVVLNDEQFNWWVVRDNLGGAVVSAERLKEIETKVLNFFWRQYRKALYLEDLYKVSNIFDIVNAFQFALNDKEAVKFTFIGAVQSTKIMATKEKSTKELFIFDGSAESETDPYKTENFDTDYH